MKKQYNIAFIDGQNMHLGTASDGWKADLYRFRVYLNDKYKVGEAYYFLGYISDDQQELYKRLQKAGFIVIFKKHHDTLKSQKKGNVDADIIFEIMRNLIDESDHWGRVVLVSGDGDYKKVVSYLIDKARFLKVLFPSKKFASSLYKELGSEYYDYLLNIKSRIQYKKDDPK
jgi:uncharacterized LabA/DUF88 family protein